MRPSPVWLVAGASLLLYACYAEIPGSAVDESTDSGGLPGGGLSGSTLGGGTLGGGTPGGGIPGGRADGGALLDGASVDGSASEAGTDASHPTCDGVSLGVIQQRIRYAESQVVEPSTCRSETQSRTCQESGFSAWSGSYQAESCAVSAVRSCGATASGGSETRQLYPLAKTDDYTKCAPETQTRSCTDGSWSDWTGSAQSATCQVTFMGKCGVSNLFSGTMCDTNTTCYSKGITLPRCLGNSGHSCSANNECVWFCVDGSCTGGEVPRGGACDDATDCSSTSCPTAGGGSTTASCVANVCACANNSTCTSNGQCVGTCVAQSLLQSMCVAVNTSCDNNDDCRGDYKCIKSGAVVAGICKLPDGKGPCSADAQCEHICRAGTCGQLGSTGESCAENADCAGTLVCRPTALGASQCAAQGGLGELCDEPIDCGGTTTCSEVQSTGSKLCLGATGASCAVGAATYQCASGVCIPCTMGPECTGSLGSCQ